MVRTLDVEWRVSRPLKDGTLSQEWGPRNSPSFAACLLDFLDLWVPSVDGRYNACVTFHYSRFTTHTRQHVSINA